MHYRTMYPSDYLNAIDLLEKGVTEEKGVNVVIEKVAVEQVPAPDGKKKAKAVVTFKGKDKKWPLPRGCANMIAMRYGSAVEGWEGKTITIYPTTCMAFGNPKTDCIRVRL